MQKSENEIIKISELNSLRLKLIELEEENKLLHQRLQNIASGNQLTQERDSVVFYLEFAANRIHGIPSVSKLVKEVIFDLASQIKNGEHFKLDNFSRRR